MKVMRWAMCMAAFALGGGFVVAEDVDVQALQAKLAAQEARLNDLQAKIYGDACEEQGLVADGITSIRKNATVTIGGTVNTRYDYVRSTMKSRFAEDENGDLVDVAGQGRRVLTHKKSTGNLGIADAKLEGQITVSDHFDAYFKFDLQDDTDSQPGIGAAQNYWVRWKNVCNSGFGILIGRDSVKFGGIQPYGRWDSWNAGIGDMGSSAWAFGDNDAWINNGWTSMAIADGMPVRSALWANSRTTQINPYWENQDGTFKAEVSLFQAIDNAGYERERIRRDGSRYYDRINAGFGSFTGRITWMPVEGLTLTGSVMNLYAKNAGENLWEYPSGGDEPETGVETSKNNFSTNLGFEYRPVCFDRLNVFATWTHGWNEAWVKKQRSDSISFGLGFNVLENLELFAYGEHVRATAGRASNDVDDVHKASGWAAEVGAKYQFPYGVWIDAGWRHETMTYKNRAGEKHTKLTGDSFYTTLGFDF